MTRLLGAALVVLCTAGVARAELDDNEVSTRLHFIEERLRCAEPINGTRELRGLPDATPQQRLYKLRRAEALLERNAHESDRRYLVVAHAANLALNLIGGLIVWLGFDDFGRAAESTGIGLAVGELSIWSQPWQPKHDWQEYQRRFGGERQRSVGATVTPQAGGGVLTIRF